MKAKQAINVAIISTGDEGAHLTSMLNDCPSINIIGLCNPRRDTSNALIAQEMNIPLFDKIEELPAIGDVDLIIDAADEAIVIGQLEGLGSVEVIKGKSADVIKDILARQRSYGDDIDNILAVGYEFASQKDSKAIYRTIVEHAIKITGCAAGSVVIFNEKTETCKLADLVGYSKNIGDFVWELQPGGITESLLDGKGPLLIDDIKQEPLFDNPVMNEGTISVLATALKEADDVIGFLFVGDFKPRKFSDREVMLFSAFAGQASLALQKALLIEKTEELSVTDSLTGLNNGRHFFATLDGEIMRAQRYGGYFAVLLMDVDNLNYINDDFGFAKGDWALKKIADTIRSCSRQTDYKARYGGDEFAMILPSTSCAQASILANRIRRQVHDLVIEGNGKEMRLSVSVGLAEFPSLGPDRDELMSAVDTALYICKQRGRNLVCCYDDTGEPAGLS